MALKERLVRFRSFWMFPLIAIVLVNAAFHAEPERSYTELLWMIPMGIFVWTLLEYGLHRFVFHIPMPIRSAPIRDFVNASHLSHHAAPRDPSKLLVKSLYGSTVSAVLLGLLYSATRSAATAVGIMTGIWAGFLYYEAVHYRVHFNLSSSPFISWQRRAHFYHHFTNSRRCFGVTSPLWDHVFKTARPRPRR